MLRSLRLLGGAICLLIGLGQSVSADARRIAAICDSAAEIASRESGVPVDVLRAISLTETGRKSDGEFRPWPWTVNMEGVGKWFDDVRSAKAYVDRHFARGARSFDVGCFQINYKWHGQAFDSIEAMFDPITNARYAAKFLSELFAEFGDWSRAAGAYHSRTPKYANRYTARFDRFRSRLPNHETFQLPEVDLAAEPVPRQSPTRPARENRFPLLIAGRSSGPSLVPLQGDPRPLIDLRPARTLWDMR
ncbi:MAG: transglycosylase SLT domain-containing protein [Paracoccaceae bacterium]|nr:transglycosylase SLT domain-containing protein [Paracoccaceae bacterium]